MNYNMQQNVTFTILGDFVAKNANIINIDKELLDIIQHSDFSLCNFEAPISEQNSPSPKSGPSLCQPSSSATFIENIGINIVALGNNHIMDYGVEGAITTSKSFRKAISFGVGLYDEVYSAKILNCNRFKIGLLSLVQHEFGTLDEFSSESLGVAWIMNPNISDIVKSAKYNVDYLLILPHAGLEDEEYPLPEWRDVYKKLIDWGADAVIASHPHIVQGWELYKGKPIFYSLGNFYFDNKKEPEEWYRSIIVQLQINENGIKFNVRPIKFTTDGNIIIDKTTETAERLKAINRILADNIQYMSCVNQMCNKYYAMYADAMVRGLSSISLRNSCISTFVRQIAYIIFNKPNELTLLNILRCESHRWAIQRVISNRNNIEL